jgi:hypothetical protein
MWARRFRRRRGRADGPVHDPGFSPRMEYVKPIFAGHLRQGGKSEACCGQGFLAKAARATLSRVHTASSTAICS